MLDAEILKDVSIKDMPNSDMELVAELCGIDVAVLLLQQLGGTQISIPKLGFRRLVERYIVTHYTGNNASELAVRLGVSQRFVFSVLERHRKQRQATLFDELREDK